MIRITDINASAYRWRAMRITLYNDSTLDRIQIYAKLYPGCMENGTFTNEMLDKLVNYCAWKGRELGEVTARDKEFFRRILKTM